MLVLNLNEPAWAQKRTHPTSLDTLRYTRHSGSTVTDTQHERRDCKYNSSTLALAHGVLRKNFKLDLMLGS